jgi:hypothetical protein
MTDQPHGLARGLTNYGRRGLSLYLRRSFAKSMGYSRGMLARPRGMIGDGSPADPHFSREYKRHFGEPRSRAVATAKRTCPDSEALKRA